MTSREAIREYWDKRSTFGMAAGTNDVVLKRIEIAEIISHVEDKMRIFDFGCGNGVTALEIAKKHDVHICAMDYSDAMISAAKEMSTNYSPLKGAVVFKQGDASSIKSINDTFDIAYTERVLINLKDFEEQKKAIQDIIGLLRSGGRYLMCENSHDGLHEINELRKLCGLDAITPPWHNCYFHEKDIQAFKPRGAVLEDVIPFTSTYYFLSRVVNAALAADEGREPQYENPINLLALKLPPIGTMGQTKLWVWRKMD